MSEVVLEKQFRPPWGWEFSTIENMISFDGLFVDGDWVESKDQDPNGNIRLTQLADIGVNVFKNKSNRFMTINKTKELNCTILQKNDLLIARMPDPLGRACLFPEFDQKCVTVVDVAIIRLGKHGCNPKWLMYMINSPLIQNKIFNLQSGTTRKRISRKNLSKILFNIPPLNEQKRIVAKIEELFSKLVNAQDTLQKVKLQLHQYRQSLLKSAFEGKFTEKWRQKNKPILQKEEIELWKNQRQSQYDEGCKLSTTLNKPKLPEFKIIDDKNIPQSWISMTIESIASFVIDCPHSTPKFVENGEYCIDTTCIEQSKIRWDDVRKVSSKQFQERITRMPILENDIIFSREGTVGTAVMVPKDAKLCLGQRVMMFRFPDFLNPKLCELFLQSSNFRQQYSPLIGGSVAQHLNVGDIRKFKILIPTIEEQKEIISKLGLVLSLIKNTENITNSILYRLDTLRSTVLKQAFEGKLVPQDPNDEPAEILLQKIKVEKEQLKQKQKASRSTKNVK